MEIHFQSISKIAILTLLRHLQCPQPTHLEKKNTYLYNLKVSMTHPQNIVGGGGGVKKKIK